MSSPIEVNLGISWTRLATCTSATNSYLVQVLASRPHVFFLARSSYHTSFLEFPVPQPLSQNHPRPRSRHATTTLETTTYDPGHHTTITTGTTTGITNPQLQHLNHTTATYDTIATHKLKTKITQDLVSDKPLLHWKQLPSFTTTLDTIQP